MKRLILISCCLLLKEPLVITTYLINPESASEDVYVILGSGLDIKKAQNAVSKHQGVLPKIKGGGNSAKVCVKRASSALLVACLVFCLMLSGVPVKCLASVCPVASLPECLTVNNFI